MSKPRGRPRGPNSKPAIPKRGGPGRPKGKKSAYNRKIFYLDNKLYKRLEIRRHENLVLCWDFEEHKSVAFVWSDCRRRMKRAYTVREAAALCNRAMRVLHAAISDGKITRPPKTYSIHGHEGYPGVHYFSDKHIMEYRDYLAFETNQHGWQRKDGLAKRPRKPVPSRTELLAKLKDGTIVYAKTSDGTFIPVWDETAYD